MGQECSVFAPVALAGMFGNAGAWLNAGLAFVAIGFLASATYLINDLSDLADDRRHWSKRNRPLASGRMSIPVALLLVPSFLVIAAGLASSPGLPCFRSLPYMLRPRFSTPSS